MLNNVVSVLVEMVILGLFAAPCGHLKDTIILKEKILNWEGFLKGGDFKGGNFRGGNFKGE